MKFFIKFIILTACTFLNFSDVHEAAVELPSTIPPEIATNLIQAYKLGEDAAKSASKIDYDYDNLPRVTGEWLAANDSLFTGNVVAKIIHLTALMKNLRTRPIDSTTCRITSALSNLYSKSTR